MKEKLALFVVSHKRIDPKFFPGRKVILVGSKNFPILNCKNLFYDCREKDNISEKNPYYCELTALYWVWKHYHNAEYIGFEHYRRLFYRNIFQIADIDYLYNKALKYDVIHKPNWWHFTTVKNVIKKQHSEKLYLIFKDSITKVAPEYLECFNKVMNSHHCKYCNTIIMKKTLFDNYMDFMFKILVECEKHLKKVDKRYQPRAIGYLSERLLDVYIQHNHLTHAKNYLKFTSKLYKRALIS